MTTQRVESSDACGQWIDAARSGDSAAFSELVKITRDEVYTLAFRLTADSEMAADVLQEAYIRAWRALPKFRGDAAFSTWMHRITVNAAWTHKRKMRRHHATPLDQVDVEPHAEGLSPERAGFAAAIEPKLSLLLAELPANQRAVVVLKDVYGWTHGEVSEHLGITITAAKVRLHRAHKLLRGALWDE